MKTMNLIAVALLLSAGAYAQNSPLPPTAVTPPAPGQRRDLTPEQSAAVKAERKAKLDKMTPAERKAFRETHRAQREARLKKMPAEKRERITQRRQAKKEK